MFSILEKYKPKTFNDIAKKYPMVAKTLKNMNKNNISNLLIYGNDSSGKKTILYTFLDNKKQKKVETHNKTIDFTIYYSNTFIEIDVKEMGIYKKYILKDVIKNFTKSKNIVDSQNKIIIIHNLQLLNIEDQYILRKIIEENICNCRFILLSNNINNLIDPIKSRCLCLRLDGFNQDEIYQYLSNISETEGYNYSKDEILEIIKNNKCNLKKSTLELIFNKNYECGKELNTKEQQINDEIKKLINIVKNKTTFKKNIDDIETIIYDLYINFEVDFILLIKLLYEEIIIDDITELKKIELCKLMMEANKNRMYGSKEIYHSQNFIYNLLKIYHPN